MADSAYTFSGAERERELERLRRIEDVADPASWHLLKASGMGPGWSCLEVGAGAGSIAAWMAERVGSEGEVVAIDLDAGFLDATQLPGVRIIEGDIRELNLHAARFDVVHARYVLVHSPDYEALLDAMVAALKPGGRLVVEEPDFTAAKGASGADIEAFERVNRSIVAMFEAGGKDPGIGLRLPALLTARGLALELVETEVPLCHGGHALAEIMSLSAVQLRDKYLATGLVSEEDLAGYARFAADPRAWGIYYGAVGVVARQPAKTAPPSAYTPHAG
ncbi:class I SAM-dependent methyltransferase [Sorangium sp. So ce131]|uniref:class I SAM-dependent methyltransferase n=1 Tax=Sorangium sp. So ce131 TaxID=3133282 RepID=UPI003F61A522